MKFEKKVFVNFLALKVTFIAIKVNKENVIFTDYLFLKL